MGEKTRIYFVTSNIDKYKELKKMFDLKDAELAFQKKDSLLEIQTTEAEELIKRKALEAFRMLQRPLIVEHTCLSLDAFSELPGTQTNHFYTVLGNEKIVYYCSAAKKRQAYATTYMCFCDGQNYYIESGTISCEVADSVPESCDGFAWDDILIPTENNPKGKTMTQLGKEWKERYSMRKKAWNKLKKHVQNYLDRIPKDEIPEREAYIQELAELIHEKKVMLFLGAGISASIHYPTWSGFIRKLGEDAGFDSEIFESYGDKMMLAEYISILKKSDLFQEIQESFSLDSNPEVKEDLKASDIYHYLFDLDFPVIYTTNYDDLIEKYYEMRGKEIVSVSSVQDLKKLDPQKPKILKFHGSVLDEDGKQIVLMESQYFSRMDFQSFMDVFLQADMMGYHVLFLGYGMGDFNIKLLLYLANKRGKRGESLPKAYIFTALPNMVQEAVFKKNGITPITGSETDMKIATELFLKDLDKRVKKMNNSYKNEKQSD